MAEKTVNAVGAAAVRRTVEPKQQKVLISFRGRAGPRETFQRRAVEEREEVDLTSFG
jgi:hypothetical protein